MGELCDPCDAARCCCHPWPTLSFFPFLVLVPTHWIFHIRSHNRHICISTSSTSAFFEKFSFKLSAYFEICHFWKWLHAEVAFCCSPPYLIFSFPLPPNSPRTPLLPTTNYSQKNKTATSPICAKMAGGLWLSIPSAAEKFGKYKLYKDFTVM